MDAVLLAMCFMFLVTGVIAALTKRWFPFASVAIGITCLSGMSASFLALLAIDAFAGQVQNFGRGTGVVLLIERPGSFWALVALYAVSGGLVLVGSAWALRKHLKGNLWPSR